MSGDETGEVFGEGCWRVKLAHDMGDGWYERVGVWGEISDAYWTRTSSIRDQDARIDVTISDTSGCSVSSGWTIHVAPDLGI